MNPAFVLQQLIIGDWVSQAVQVAAKLGIADLIHEGTVSVDELATATSTHPESLYRLLRALTGIGVFTESPNRSFSLTAVGNFLRSDVPGSLRALATIHTDIEWPAWGQLLHSVRTGETGFRHVHGMGYFDYLERHPALGRLFDQGMTEYVSMHGAAITAVYDFTPYSTIVDVGGGRGTLMTKILAANPQARGIVFDLPKVVAELPPSARWEPAGGSFFDAIPPHGDLYVMASILHDWDDDRARLILENCRRVMSPQAKLLLIEMLLPPGNAPSFTKLLDLEMLVCFGGKERSETEYRQLLISAGFRLTQVISTPAASSILVAEPDLV